MFAESIRRRSKPMVYAIDFDGTLFTNKYPEVGEPIWSTINWVKRQKENGHKFILWTCRCGKYLTEAINACKKVGIVFDAVNNNVEEKLSVYKDDSRKVGADYYIDDKALSPTILTENFVPKETIQ